MRNERERGVIVKVLDLSAFEAEALEFRQRTHPDCYEAKIYGGKIAFAQTKTGHLYTVCTEGVGPEFGVTFDDPLEVEFHGSYYARDEHGEINPSSHSFDFLPFASSTLNPDKILSYPVAEEVDLADFIRSFGARLENNFWMWFKVLS